MHIEAAVAQVWEVLADLGEIARWAPTIGTSYLTTETREGVGAGRHLDLVGGQALLVQSGSFLAATMGVSIDTKWGGAKAFFSREGLSC